MFDYLNYRNKIPVEKCILPKIPALNPLSIEYKKFWKDQKRKCIEGNWVEHEGEWKWVPGPIHFYVNLWHILLKDKNAKSKTKAPTRPLLRDLEWIKGYVYVTARGFSGFELDKEYSCHRLLELDEEERLIELDMYPVHVKAALKKPNGQWKTYKPALEYLYGYFTKDLGKPQYYNFAKNVVDIESRGGGKDLEANTLIHSLNKSFPIKDVKVGDQIFGRDGKLTTVTQRKDYFDQLQYEVKLSDGRTIECGEGHLWTVRQKVGKGYKIVTTTLGEIKNNYLIGTRQDSRYFVPICQPLEYEEKDLPVDPYFLGLWLGDGCCGTTGITSADSEIEAYLKKYAESLDMNFSKVYPDKNASFYRITKKTGKTNKLLNALRQLGVLHTKKIPDLYLKASIEQRLSLLQGLMDSDGFADNRHIELSTSYEGLQKTIPTLISSLGIRSKQRIKKTLRKDSLRISLLTDLPIFRLPRKLKFVGQNTSKYATTNKTWSAIVDIKPTEVKHSVCIAVNNKDNLFVAGEQFIVTHNSYTMGAFCGHNYLFDGAMDYDEYLQLREEGEPLSSETLIGAIDTKYSKDLIGKVQLGLETMEGGMFYNGTNYPPPFEKKYTGSWESGKYIINLYDKKSGGRWSRVGTKSKIQHRSFKDNPFAANGTRPSFSVIDEIGFVDNLEELLGQMAECTADGAEKFGTIWMTGTGGDMAGGSTEAVKFVFYDPAANDCLEFDDIFEGSTKKIGFFIPAWMTLNQFKDELGNTDKDRAMAYLLKIRAKKAKAKSKQTLNDELQQRPLKPSEAFLVSSGNVFPIADLKEHLNFVEGLEDGDVKGQVGELMIDSHGVIVWKPDLTNSLRACHYPMKEKDDSTGAIVIWEHPDENAGYGYYVAGNDPYDLDQAPNSQSLGSTIIMKRAGIGISNHDKIVAEYTARPEFAKEFFENTRRLLLYYNALCLYENEKNQIKTYFEQKHSLHLLAYTPTVLKANSNTTVSRVYGQHMPDKVKAECEIYLRDWLTAPAGDGKMNLHHIYSVPILQELIGYNDIGNFDRVIALMLAVVQKEQMHHIVVKKKEEIKQDPFWTKQLFR